MCLIQKSKFIYTYFAFFVPKNYFYLRILSDAVQEWKNCAIKDECVKQPVEHDWPIMATAPTDQGAALQVYRIQVGSEEAAEESEGSESDQIDQCFSLL